MIPVDTQHFPVQRAAVQRYFLWSTVLAILVVFVWLVGTGLVLAPLWALTVGPGLARKQSEALDYRLEGSTLRADSGVFFLRRCAIPVERITDVVLVQGPLMRHLGLWTIRVQTAGAPHAEATLYGVSDPEGTRDAIVAARDAIAQGRR